MIWVVDDLFWDVGVWLGIEWIFGVIERGG